MAVYRQVHISFWQDSFILDLTPEEKYFYLYLMTNSKTKQCGIYEISKKVMELETGYNGETIDKLLGRFIGYGKIEYCEQTREVFLKNWLKYNSYKSPKVMACIKKEIEEIKHTPFKKTISHRLGIDYAKSIDTETQKEKEKEEEKEQQQQDNPVAVVVDNFNKNIHPITPMELERLTAYLDDGFEPEVIIYAIEKAVTANARKLSYIEGVLKRLRTAGTLTMESVMAAERDFQDRKKPPDTKPKEPEFDFIEYEENGELKVKMVPREAAI